MLVATCAPAALCSYSPTLPLLSRPSQTDLGEASEGGAGAAPQFIKPEHLSSVIASSHADYLVVIGDRNMKNDTVQARRAGKLVEQPYVARINSLLESWGTAMCLRGGVGSGGSGGGSSGGSGGSGSGAGGRRARGGKRRRRGGLEARGPGAARPGERIFFLSFLSHRPALPQLGKNFVGVVAGKAAASSS